MQNRLKYNIKIASFLTSTMLYTNEIDFYVKSLMSTPEYLLLLQRWLSKADLYKLKLYQ